MKNPLTPQPQPSLITQSRHHPNAAFESLKPDLLSTCKPKLWKVLPATDIVQFSKVDLNVDGVFEIVNSVVVHLDFKWDVLVN